jgi:hypothetical protein
LDDERRRGGIDEPPAGLIISKAEQLAAVSSSLL